MGNTCVLYRATVDCPHVFATVPLLNTYLYPNTVLYLCPACDIHHFFRASGSYDVSTPLALKRFKAYCELHNILEIDVVLPE